MIKNKFILTLVVAAGVILPTAAQALDFHIDVGDRGYYTHGARYYRGDYEYVWVPGHREGRHWVHGYYRRGERRHRH